MKKVQKVLDLPGTRSLPLNLKTDALPLYHLPNVSANCILCGIKFINFQALPIAERKFASEFWYRGSFISQLDGDVGYIPKNKEADFLIIVPDFSAVEETPEQDSFIKYRAIKFPKGSGVFIEAFVPHSTPIPLNESGEFEFDVYKRGVGLKMLEGQIRSDLDLPGLTLPLTPIQPQPYWI